MPKLVRITTVPISLQKLITGQMKYMQSNGFDVKMMSAEGPEINEVKAFENCEHIVVDLTRKITLVKDLRALRFLYKYFKFIQPDIVHTHTPKAGLIGMLAAKLAGVPVRIHTVAGLPLETASGLKKIILVNTEKITYWAANHIWPNSKSLHNYILNHKLAKEDKLTIIGNGSSNGIDIEEFDIDKLDTKKLDQIKQKINFSNECEYLLFVGRVVKDKGIIELIDAFMNLSVKYDQLRLIIVGPLEQELDPLPQAYLDHLLNNPKIVHTGFSNEVKYYMKLATIFVFPSYREGFPNVPMQAAMMNLPVVASRITGNVDIIDDDENGFLFEKSNTQEMIRKIDLLLSDEDLRLKLASNLRYKVVNNYDRKVIHKLILKEYDTLVNHG